MIFLSLALKGAAVLLTAALAVRLLHRAPAALRHGIWAAAFGALLLLPVLEAAGPRWAVGLLPAAPSTVVSLASPPAPPAPPPSPAPPAPPPIAGANLEAETIAFERGMSRFEAEASAFEREMEAFEAEMSVLEAEFERDEAPTTSMLAVVKGVPTMPRSLTSWLMMIWAAGAGVVGLWWAGAALAARRLVATARREVDDDWWVVADRARRLSGLEEPLRLLRSGALDVPIAWGFGIPAVVLPEGADEWDEDRREAVLLHEMAHLRRHDAWTQAVAQIAVAVHWFNPLAWWGYRQHLDAREQACDDAVIQGGARPSAYAAHLVGVARAIRREPVALAAVAPMARTAPLETRIHSILDADRRRGRLGLTAQIGTVALILSVLLPIAAFQPVHAKPDAPALKVEPPAPPTAALEADPVLPSSPAPQAEPSRTETVAAPDTLDEVRAHIRRAQAEVRRTLRDADGPEAEVAQMHLLALREAERALADVDLEAIRLEALDAAMEARQDALEAAQDAREDAHEAAQEAREDAHEHRLEAEAARRIALEALESVDMPAVWSQVKRDLEAGLAPPPPAPEPPPPPAPARRDRSSASVDSASVDWDSVDRARVAAVNRSIRRS